MYSTEYLKGSIEHYLEDLSDRKMAPGGGSAAALNAALGVALSLMVIRYSVKHAESEAVLSGLKDDQEAVLSVLEELIDEDCRVFSELMVMLSEKKDAEDAYKASASVPLKISAACVSALNTSRSIMPHVNPRLKSDIACALHMLKGAFFSAELNVEVNLKFIKDKDFIKATRDSLNKDKELIFEAEKEILASI
ncbi:MAG: cyclodeaminase/cyclohydrolase family protein [Candidatus Omnitrophota bacterium]|nr:cyclodeaminase/cyclohydrolase family protein [Candidatus Omnitrophota bacterium]